MIEITSQRLAASRWAARAPRLAAVGALAVLAATGLRGAFADAPAPAIAPPQTDVRDTVTEAVAQEFARDYLTLDDVDRDTESRRPELSRPTQQGDSSSWRSPTPGRRRSPRPPAA